MCVGVDVEQGLHCVCVCPVCGQESWGTHTHTHQGMWRNEETSKTTTGQLSWNRIIKQGGRRRSPASPGGRVRGSASQFQVKKKTGISLGCWTGLKPCSGDWFIDLLAGLVLHASFRLWWNLPPLCSSSEPCPTIQTIPKWWIEPERTLERRGLGWRGGASLSILKKLFQTQIF